MVKCLDCNLDAKYNVNGIKPAIYCKNHRKENMLHVELNRCQYKGCLTVATFNEPGIKKGIFCKPHAPDGYIDNTRSKCDLCDTVPQYRIDMDTPATRCSKHKLEGMVKKNYGHCDMCEIKATYNFPDQAIATKCKSHAEPNMVDIKHKLCIACKRTRPSFNYIGETVGLYCAACKLDDMICVLSKMCIVEGCKIGPSYGIDKRTHCFKHHDKLTMKRIGKSSLCQDCGKRASFNFIGEITPIKCKEHMEVSMIDVINKRCAEQNCLTQPSFNYLGEVKALYCSKHAKPDMICLRLKKCQKCKKVSPTFGIDSPTHCNKCKTEEMTDQTHRKCKKCNKKRAYYIVEGEKIPSYCADCRPDDSSGDQNELCMTKDCYRKRIYGSMDGKPTRCEIHKAINHVNLILENKCSVIDCDNEHTIILESEKYCSDHLPEGSMDIIHRLCKYCDLAEVDYVCSLCKKVKNKKEYAIVRLLRREINTKFIYDSSKMLQGCSKKRPDVYFDLPSHVVIVEIDENQHNRYDSICECARINEIVNSIGGRPVIVIRYNPDSKVKQIEILLKTVRDELVFQYEKFMVKLIQIGFDNVPQQSEDITDLVCI
jgi:hypothetical protein